MNKLFCLLLCTILSACTTISYTTTDNNQIPSILDESINSQTTVNIKDDETLSLEEKYSIISLFEELRPHKAHEHKPIDVTELTCLAQTLYFEARGESDEGMLAVGHVVLNRVTDNRFPKTICEVVKQGKHIRGKPVRNKCQFSWYCDGLPDTITDGNSYIRATELALSILTGESDNPVSNSLFYHAIYVRPRWSRVFVMVRKINNHLFYTYRDLVIARN